MESRKYKVLHLATHLNLGGISSYLLILGEAFTKRGHVMAVLSSGGQKKEDLERAGIRCFDLPIRTKSELHPKLLWAVPKVVSLVKNEKFDLMHAHSRVTQVLAAAVSRLTGLPYISTAHGFYNARWGRKLFPCWGERAVAISDLVAQELSKTHAVSQDKIRVIHNALDLDALEKRLSQKEPFKIRSEHGIPPEAFVVGCISRLVRDKGQEYLVEALRSLAGSVPNIFLWIVGDGRERGRLEALIKKYSLQDHVRLDPGVNDTTTVLSAIDVFAHPATFREGFGLAMAEAMVAKKPVVATTIPAINTIFQNGVEAVLVPPKNAPALAQAIQQLAADKKRALSIAENGHALAVRLCNPVRQAEEMERVYREIVAA